MVSRLFLLNRKSSRSVQAVFLLRQNMVSEQEVRGGYVPPSRAFFLLHCYAWCFVQLVVFCAIQLYACVSVRDVINLPSGGYLTCSKESDVQRTTKRVLDTVQW